MKKIMFAIMFVFLISLTSAAWDWDNVKDYDEIKREITIKNALGLGEDLAKYKLTYNTDQCLINCYAEGIAIFYTDGQLFTDLKFQGVNVKSNRILIEVEESYEIDVPDYKKICEEEVNGTSCYSNQVGSHKETRYRNIWLDYDDGVLGNGTYKWRIEGKKNERGNVDWVGSAFGEDFTEWDWWNDSWEKKKQMDITGVVSSKGIFVVVNKTNMQSNGEDLRFVNSSDIPTSEEFIFQITSVNATDLVIYINTSTNDTIYMYYNNSIADGTNDTWGYLNKYEYYDTGVDNYGTIGQDGGDDTTYQVFTVGTTGVNETFSLHKFHFNVDWNTNAGTTLKVTYTDGVDATSNGCTSTNVIEYVTPTINPTTIGFSTTDAGIRNWTNISFSGGSLANKGGVYCVKMNSSLVGGWYMDRTGASYTGGYSNYIESQPTVRAWVAMFEVWGRKSPEPTVVFGAEQVNEIQTTLISPVNDFNSSVDSINFTASSNPNQVNLTNATLSIWYSNDSLYATNFTSLSGNVTVLTSWNMTSIPDGDYIWNVLTRGTESQSDWGVNRTFGVDTSFPIINVTSPRGAIDYYISGNNLTLNWSIVESNPATCWFEYDSTNTTVNCGATNYSFTPTSQTNLTFYANDTFGNENSNYTNWSYKLFENSIDFNITTYETAPESFFINLSSDGTQTITANLFYDGVDEGTSTKTGDNNEMVFSQTIQIPTGVENKTFYWAINYGSELINSTFTNQTVNATNLTLCGAAPQDTEYINFTFKNETTSQEDVNATIISTWIYWLGDGSVNKSLSYSNVTENTNYAFCFSPSHRPLIAILELAYNNGESQQRLFNPTLLLTNVTINQVLYLLPTSAGLFSPFSVVRPNSDPIADVLGTISRSLGGSTVTVASDFTDSSGFVTYFLNPDVSYSAVFSKSGFTDNSFSFIPTADLRTVVMGGELGEIGNGTEILLNTSFTITPTNNTLQNNSDVLFGFNVTSTQTITLISMNITNSSGTELNFTSNAGTGFISVNVNTENLSRIIGYYIIQTADETISVSKTWIVGIEFVGDYSLFNQLNLFNRYGFNDFIRLLLILATIIGTIIFMSSKEIIDTSESKVIVAVLLIWAFSLVGWLDTGLVVNSAEENINILGQYSNQFGVAILSTTIGVFFIFRRVFIRRI